MNKMSSFKQNMTSPPQGMLLTTFLAKNYDWAQEPHLYVVEQIPQILENPAMRCGAAGTALYKDADAPFRSSESSQKGLQGRLTQYNNYFLPNIGKIHACLRIRKQLVALPFQRIAGDDDNPYNVDRGNQTEVLAREKHFHYFLDQMDLRWRKDTNKELFVPTQGVMQLVEAMRKVQGLQLLLFDEDDWRNDDDYKGGEKAPIGLSLVETTRRSSAVAKANAEQSIIVKMSSSGIAQLRAGQPQAYARLMHLMREAFRQQTGAAEVITLKLNKQDVEDLQKQNPSKFKKVVDIVDAVLGRKKPPPPPALPPPPLPRSESPFSVIDGMSDDEEPLQPPRLAPRTRDAIRQRLAARFPGYAARLATR